MKKLVVFGDSFVADWDPNQCIEPGTVGDARNGWIFGLGKKLQIPIRNSGIAGSGLGYSETKFFEYITSSDYDHEDIIVFALTMGDRPYCFSMPDPGLGVSVHWENYEFSNRKWLEEHRHNLVWAATDVLHPKINYESIKIMSTLKLWAAANPSNILLAIPLSYEHNYNLWEANGVDLTHLWKSADNFISLQDKMGLFRISDGEFLTRDIFLESMNNGDVRPNHLSGGNAALLIDMVYDILTMRNPEYYAPGKFKQGFITEVQHYIRNT